jgi:hypothetical protein
VAHGYVVVQKVVNTLPVAIDKNVDNIAHVMLMLILTKKNHTNRKEEWRYCYIHS